MKRIVKITTNKPIDKICQRLRFGILALLTSSLATASLSAADYTWTGLTGADWSESANWSPAVVPNAVGDSVTVTTAVTINLTNVPNTTFTVGNITNAAAGTVVFGANNTSDDVLTLAVNSGSPVLSVSNASQAVFCYASLAGTQGFTKTGGGRWTFRFNGATNTFSGPVNILGGVLGIEKDESLGDTSNAINIANGARLTAEPGNGGNTFSLAATRTMTLTGASQIGVSGAAVTFSIPGTVTGTGDIRKTDAGTLVLDGVANYSGETRILGGGMTVNTTSGEFTQQKFLLLQAQANGFLDYSALTNFTFSNGTAGFQVVPNTSSGIGVINQLSLARAGDFGGLNTITANSMQIGGGNTSAGSLHEGQLHLGTTNFFNLNTNGMLIGGFNASGLIDFQGGLTSPFLKIRGTNGTSRMAGTFKVGETSSGSRSGAGNLNLSGGFVDALLTDMFIGRHIAGANNSESSSVTMDDGTLDAITITMSEKDNGGAGASWPTFNDTFNQNNGTVKVAKFVMGNDLKLTNLIVINAVYNLNNGTLYAGSIGGGVGGFNTIPSCNRTFNLNGGTVRNYDSSSNLVINGVGTPRYARISLVLGGSPVSFYADSGRSITIGANASLEGFADFTKDGPGDLIINSVYTNNGTGKLTVNAGTVGGTGLLLGALDVTAGGKLSPGTSVGTLTVSNELTLAGATLMELNRTNTPANCDQVIGLANVIYGGTLVVTNLGDTLQVGDSFKLFDSLAYNGSFASITYPAGYTFTNKLAIDGTIQVLTAPVTTPPVLTYEIDGSNWVFNWTGSGFKLQVQTNTLAVGISDNWADVLGGNTSGVSVPGPNTANPAVFYRLISTP